MDHLPVGPYEPGSGWHSSPVWPAFWFAGDDNTNGEIDPYEGFNPVDTTYSGIHNWDPAKYGNCTLPDDIEKYFNGSGRINGGWTELSPHGTADEPFNRAGGGVYAVQWDREKFVRVWTFVKLNIPTDILNVRLRFSTDLLFALRKVPIQIQTHGACRMRIFHSEHIVTLIC
jgi:hypothetical protein